MTLNQYYQYYLTLHSDARCRRLHFLGQCATIAFIVSCLVTNKFLFLIAAPFVVYPFAWSGHFLFEKNEPAAFKDPVKAKICDWIMFKDILLGKVNL